jgi:putative transposase
VLSGYLARYLFAARGGLAPRPADAHRAGAHGPEQALTLRQPAPGLIIHADRGSQYTSSACRTRIEKAQALASYSRPGNPYDNAQAEAGWSTLKTELLPHGGAFASLEEARLEVAYYLDTYFNLDRRHSALGYRSPHQFKRDFQSNLS